MDTREKEAIERTIAAARNGVGQSIDELDRSLRKRLDVQTLASEHAPQLVAAGAVVGFLAGFGMPKVFKRVLQLGVPVAVVAWKVRQAQIRRASSES
jgi:hypothetical protein